MEIVVSIALVLCVVLFGVAWEMIRSSEMAYRIGSWVGRLLFGQR